MNRSAQLRFYFQRDLERNNILWNKTGVDVSAVFFKQGLYVERKLGKVIVLEALPMHILNCRKPENPKHFLSSIYFTSQCKGLFMFLNLIELNSYFHILSGTFYL